MSKVTEEERTAIVWDALCGYRYELSRRLELLSPNDPLRARIKEKIAECDQKITQLKSAQIKSAADVVPMRSIEDLPINRGFSIGHKPIGTRSANSGSGLNK